MADTWGDIIGRNYGRGRAIGDDFSSMRFQRKAAAVRDEFEQRAEAEGKTLQDYLPEIETRLRGLAKDVGATRRGVVGRRGEALDREYATDLSADVARAGERRAGALALAGKQAEARQSRAGTQYAIGDFDAGQGQQIAGETIAATQGALRPDGTYDMAGGAQALAGVGARYGNAEAANAQQQGATTFRLQAARAKADAVFNMAQNPEAFSPDQFAGAWQGFKETVPELAHVDLRKGPDNILYIYTDGKPSGSFDPKNKTDAAELATIMTQFTRVPGESLANYNAARLKNIEEQKTQATQFSGKIDDAMIKVISEGKQIGLPDGLVTKLANSGTGSGESKGWQLQELGDEPGTYLMQKGGNVYTVKTNVAPNLETGEVGGTVQVFDANGRPVNASVLNAGEREGFDYTLSLVNEIATVNDQRQASWIKGQLSLLNSLRNQRLGLQDQGGSSAPAAGGTGGAPQGTPATYRGPGTVQGELPEQSPSGTFYIETGTDPTAAAAIRKEEIARGGREVPPPAQGAGALPRSAPAARSPIQRQATISRETVRGLGQNLLQLREDYLQKKQALEQFEQDFNPQLTSTFMSAREGAMPVSGRRYADPAQQRVGDQLRQDVAEAERALRAATADTRASTGALKRQSQSGRSDEDAAALYQRYGGAADFFKAAGQ